MKRRKWLQRLMTRNKNLSNGSDIDFYEVKAKQKHGVFWSCHTKLFIRCGEVAIFRMTRGTLEKLCREVAATGCIPQGIRFGVAPIPGEDDQLESIEPVSKERKGAKRVSAEFTDYWRQRKWRWVFEYIISNTTSPPIPGGRHSWFESNSI